MHFRTFTTPSHHPPYKINILTSVILIACNCSMHNISQFQLGVFAAAVIYLWLFLKCVNVGVWAGLIRMSWTVCNSAWGRITFGPQDKSKLMCSQRRRRTKNEPRINLFIWLTRWLHKNSRHSDLICSTGGPRKSFHFVTLLFQRCALHKSIQFVINFKTFHFILILMPANACRRRSCPFPFFAATRNQFNSNKISEGKVSLPLHLYHRHWK